MAAAYSSISNSGDDKVVLYISNPTPNVVQYSPPCLKLETFLRMANISYTPIYGFKPSSKGKMPWIEHKGTAVADSYFCIQFLSKEFGVDLDEHLTPEQKGFATAFIVMLEENTYWTLGYYNFFSPYSEKFKERVFGNLPGPLKWLVFKRTQSRVRDYLYSHGIGRHTEEEMYGIAKRDLQAVSSFLGEKKFLFGDKPCIADAALFGLVTPFVWEVPESPQGSFISTELTNLVDHATRMKELYYPDWDQIIAQHSS